MMEPGQELRQQFILGMSYAASTVNVVTTDGAAGRAGVTVSAMSSVSADTPRPTLLVCVHHASPAAEKIQLNGVFCVNMLRDDQSYISDTFAGRFKEQLADKFDCAEWVAMPSGAPRVVDPLVGFDCRLGSAERVGTHFVFMGEVQDVFVSERGSPLIYAHRAYGSHTRFERVAGISARKPGRAGRLSVGCLHTFGPYVLPELVSQLSSAGEITDFNLVEGDQRRVQESLQAGEVEIAFLYDFNLPGELERQVLVELEPYVLLADGHPLAARARLKPQDLADHPMVLLNAPPSSDYFTSIMRSEGIEPNIAYRSTSFEMVRGLVGHGLGYAILATRPASSLTYDGRALTTRPLDTKHPPGHVAVVWRKGASLSTAATSLLDLCRNLFD